MSIRGAVGEQCLMDVIWTANHHGSGKTQRQAAQLIAEKLEAMEEPLGYRQPSEIECDRCDAKFLVQRTVRGSLEQDLGHYPASVSFGEAGESGKECDASEVREDRLRGMGTPGAFLLNISLENVTEAAGSPRL